jgi:hypothetical protein
MNRRLYVVEKPLPASMVEASGSRRTFKQGETVWWDGDQSHNSAIFEVDNIRAYRDGANGRVAIQFVT